MPSLAPTTRVFVAALIREVLGQDPFPGLPFVCFDRRWTAIVELSRPTRLCVGNE